MTHAKPIAQFLAQSEGSASASWGWQRGAVAMPPGGRL